MIRDIDFTAAIFFTGFLATSGVAFAASARTVGRGRGIDRLDGERGLPFVGKAPLEAAYALALRLGRALAALGVPANAVTVSSVVVAAGACVCFAMGHFGLGAAVAILASLADALDGIIARETRTASRLGQVLDTTIDRYVEALFVSGIAFFVRSDGLLFVVTLVALIGGFMVSYASSVLRELGAPDDRAPMRRTHRLIYLLVGAAVVPVVQTALPEASLRVQLGPVVGALAAIGVVGNVSAVRRLILAASPRRARDPGHLGRPSRAMDGVVVSERVSQP